MKKIKVTKSQLAQLIKEQAGRYKKIYDLEQKKETIKKQLREMHESENMMGGTGVGLPTVGSSGGVNSIDLPEHDMEEGILGGIFGPQTGQKKELMRQAVLAHPNYSQSAEHIAEKFGLDQVDVENKMIDFLVKNASVVNGQIKGISGGFRFDPRTQQFVNSTKYSASFSGRQSGMPGSGS